MTITLRREIPTRLLEACVREAKALYEPLGLGYEEKIFGYPIMSEADLVNPRQLHVVNVPPNYETGVGGFGSSEYTIEFCFYLPIQLARLEEGQNTYLDEIMLLRRWLYAGGSAANRNGRLEDPDFPGKTINTEIKRFAWLNPEVLPGNVGIEVPVHVTFGVDETTDGKRPYEAA